MGWIMRKRLMMVAVGALVSAAALSACGGSKSSSSESASAADGTETTAAAGESDASGGADEKEYCAKVKLYMDQADAFDAVMESNDPADIRKGFETMQDLVHKLDDNPPSTIAEDVHTVRKLTDQFVSVFDKYDYDFTKLASAPEFAELSKLMENGEQNAASERLDKWGEKVCGFPPETASGS